MICYFVRHGPAVDFRDWDGSDFDRPLTAKGSARMMQVAKRLAKLGVAPDALVTSPLVRAEQTASIIGDVCGLRPIEDARLAGGFNPRALKEILKAHADANALMLVGHEPAMSATVGYVLGGANLEFKKGAIACVDVSDSQTPSGTLIWMVPPKLLSE